MNNSDFYKKVFEVSNVASLITEGDRIIHCNQKVFELYGFTSLDDIVGKTIWEISPPMQEDGMSSKKRGIHYLSKVISGEVFTFDWLHQRVDGSVFDSEVSLSRLDYDGKIFILANISDTSRRKELERKLVESKEKAEESTRLKTNFLANMSHDIRNPLNAILGFSKMLADESEVSIAERQRYGALIESNGNRLLNLINDIIDVSLIEANQIHIEKKRCQVNSLLEELYLSFKKEIANRDQLRLKLNIAVDDPNFALYSDPMRLRQILSNLISNAIKYTKKGFVEFGYQLVDDKTIQFFVKDSGIGIEESNLENIFNRFNRENTPETQNIHGTGLGLDISKRLVNMLGGKIWVFSTLNIGSEFYFSIPAVYLDYKPVIKKEVVKSKSLSAHDVNWSDKHILIADDDVINFELLRIILSKTKVKITKAVNGREAIDFVAHDNSIDLLLLDIQMPIMNGYQAIKEIRRMRPNLPVIAQTAVSLESPDGTPTVDLFDDYISKPIDVATLISKIQTYFS